MPDDIIARAEAARMDCPRGLPYALVDQLVAELKTARAELERLRGDAHTAVYDAWDEGNCTGLDGWAGPGRGGEPDLDAMIRRERDAELIYARLCEGVSHV